MTSFHFLNAHTIFGLLSIAQLLISYVTSAHVGTTCIYFHLAFVSPLISTYSMLNSATQYFLRIYHPFFTCCQAIFLFHFNFQVYFQLYKHLGTPSDLFLVYFLGFSYLASNILTSIPRFFFFH